jgi:hypothetical protein
VAGGALLHPPHQSLVGRLAGSNQGEGRGRRACPPGRTQGTAGAVGALCPGCVPGLSAVGGWGVCARVEGLLHVCLGVCRSSSSSGSVTLHVTPQRSARCTPPRAPPTLRRQRRQRPASRGMRGARVRAAPRPPAPPRRARRPTRAAAGVVLGLRLGRGVDRLWAGEPPAGLWRWWPPRSWAVARGKGLVRAALVRPPLQGCTAGSPGSSPPPSLSTLSSSWAHWTPACTMSRSRAAGSWRPCTPYAAANAIRPSSLPHGCALAR